MAISVHSRQWCCRSVSASPSATVETCRSSSLNGKDCRALESACLCRSRGERNTPWAHTSTLLVCDLLPFTPSSSLNELSKVRGRRSSLFGDRLNLRG